MKTTGASHRYLSGPHAGDYYLLLDERSDHIFATRLAEHVREAISTCDERAGLATVSLLEMWIDEAEKYVWYVFEAFPNDGAGSNQPGSPTNGRSSSDVFLHHIGLARPRLRRITTELA